MFPKFQKSDIKDSKNSSITITIQWLMTTMAAIAAKTIFPWSGWKQFEKVTKYIISFRKVQKTKCKNLIEMAL